MSRHSFAPSSAALLLSVLAFSSGCSKDTTGPPPVTCTAEKIAAANLAFGQVIASLQASDPTRPSDVDFRTPEGLYREALACEPSNAHANMGVAVMEMLTLSTDPEVNAAFDEWEQYLGNHVPFEIPSSTLAPMGVPLTMGPAQNALRLPFELIPLSAVAPARPGRIMADPQISRAQDILRTIVLPRVNDAITRISVPAGQPNFTFVVTPAMQGDANAEPVEIDRTDILALRAAMRLLASMCHVAVSYNLGFAAYDSVSLHQAFQPGSGWLALATGGATHMQNARADVLSSIDDIDLCITTLLAETDSQDDDIIKIDPAQFTRADLDSVRSRLPQVRQAFVSEFTLTADWDGSTSTADIPLRISIASLFTNPVGDWKALFPPYTARVERRVYNYTFVDNFGSQNIAINVPSDGYYSGSYYVSYDNFVPTYEYFYGDPVLEDSLRAVVARRFSAVQARSDWAGYYYCNAGCSEYLTAGGDSISVTSSEYFTTTTAFVGVPIIAWQATDFSQWTWPDPTLNGLLPGVLSTNQLLSTFGVHDYQWEREVVLDWTSLVGRSSVAYGIHR